MARIKPRVLEGVEILFRNFEGREDQYNREGDREFSVLLPPAAADDLAQEGWNVKLLKPRSKDEDDEEVAVDEETPFLKVAVSYKIRAPKIILITSRGMTKLGPNEVAMLDWAEITNVDMIVSGSAWEVGEKSGIKAYLQSLYVTIEEDPLELKYGDLMIQGTVEDGPPDLT